MKNCISLVLLFFCYNLYSQDYTQNQRVWFAYTGQYKVSNHWGYHIEAQFRMDNELQQSIQSLFRAGGIYYLSSSKMISGGYALVNTYSSLFGAYFKENRFWEQYQYNKKWHENKNNIIHRFRLENRWVEQIALVNEDVQSIGSNYQTRFRYLNRNLFHIISLKSTNEEIYAVVQNEVFLTLGNNKVNSKFVDQNRFLVGLGLNYNNNIRIELGYMNHFITSSASNDVMNHTISVSLIQNLDLQKH